MGFHQILYPAENDVRKLLIWFAQAGGKKIINETGNNMVEAPLIGESIVKVNSLLYLKKNSNIWEMNIEDFSLNIYISLWEK